MILAVFVIAGIAGFGNASSVVLDLQGYSVGDTCNFDVQITVAAGATKAQIEAAAKTELEGPPCSLTFETGDSVQLIT